MQPDAEGFLFPRVDAEKCIHCRKCLTHCSGCQDLQSAGAVPEQGYIALSKNAELERLSASGGVFAALAEALLKEGGCRVYGAAIDDSAAKVCHIAIDSPEDLPRLQNSKYVQSDTQAVFKQVREDLAASRKVLFSGTPCQVAALRSFLQKDDSNLFTIDIICHGVPSPAFYERNVEEISRFFSSGLRQLRFRSRVEGKWNSLYSFYLKLADGKEYQIGAQFSPYYSTFQKGYALRESCYRCPFAQKRRMGDWTIGDCDSHAAYPQFFPAHSNSALLINSEKGRAFWVKYQDLFHFSPLDIDLEAAHNKQLAAPFPRPAIRDEFYKIVQDSSWQALTDRFARRWNWQNRFRYWIIFLLPSSVLGLKKKIFRR